ncbi:MAG: TonB-dependent receptor [Sphingobacteriales bacterium]|nr:TonB-dependent receptor [Sphingobacteriales bacterium]
MISASALNAQQLTGKVKNAQGRGIEKVTLSLLSAKDSSVAKLAVSNEDGNFAFSAATGKYLISASHIGFATVYSSPFEVADTDIRIPDIVIKEEAGALAEVTVISKKPIVEVRADKTILNVGGTINATGTDALGLLRKSPGVLVDKDDHISLAGKNGVRIYMDGKPSPLSGTDLANYLKSLQSSQIEAIELITNPSAKYDAAGNAGIINIKLKKNKAYGTNGSVSAGYAIGVYAKYNGGINFNHRNKGVNIFGSYNYTDNKVNTIIHGYRTVLDTIFDGHVDAVSPDKSHGFKTGVDFFLDKKNTFGVLVNGNLGQNGFNNTSRTSIIYAPTGVVNRILQTNNSNKMKANNVNFNLNYRFADTSGHDLNVDADYGLYRNDGNQLQPNYYYNPAGTALVSQVIYRFLSPTDIDLLTFKADYEQNFKKGRLGVGGKVSAIRTNNNFQRFDISQLNPELKTLDISRSNEFDYRENINALYVNYSRQLKGKMIQLGARLEHTASKGSSYSLKADGTVNTSNPQLLKRNYTDFFPSAAITFNKNPMNQWGISYSRRIDRPAYQDLNPFEFKLDEYTYLKGNTALRPQYTHIVTITNSYKYKLNTSFSYSHVNDVFTYLLDTTERSKSFATRKNLAKQDVVSLNISYPFIYKSYMAFVNLSGNYSHYRADFGGGNRIVNLEAASFNIYMQHSCQFGKTKAWTAEISGWYNSPAIWEGTLKSKSMWTLDAGMQKNIFKGKGTFKVAVSDIFFTMKFDVKSNFAGQYTRAYGSFESRQFKAALTWRFGSSTVKAANERKDASEEEKKRTKKGGGIGTK